MPPASSPGSQVARFTTLDRAQRVRFRRAVALMVMTVLVPGSAQLVAGNRRVGRIAMRVWLGLIATGLLSVVISYFSHGFAFWAISNTWVLGLVRIVLMALAVGWALLFMDAWRLGQPLGLQRQHRLAVVGVNGVLCFSVVAALLFGAHMAGVQRNFMITMFGDGDVVGAHDGRFNVLLLGGDAGAGRWGLRPDSLTVASIDARTGKTVLVGLPRNMANFPFAEGSVMAEQFPKGFDCDDCYLNGVSTWAGDHTDLFKGSRTPGVDATVMAVEGITGLEINYWSMVNLAGFRSLVDAVGGVTLTVRDRIPVGLPSDDFYRFIEPGTRKLDGMDTLWFARARDGSDDYSRMARQKCVMNAMLQQISPQDALRNFSKIAAASSQMISTNVPKSEVDRFLDLAIKAKSQKIGTVSLVPPKVVTADPDIDVVHAMVADAIDRAEGETPAPATEDVATAPAEGGAGTKAPAATPTPPVTGGSLGSLKEGYAANQADDLGSVC
ncbi:cell envelope-related transcriptional [Nocardioides sp. CF8]|uniref:LCP family protein n=1 Tax=Nocardioides sp. CF8 TaxID=110319 RepID=UPI000330F731|nr:LCP family protein [Nocardioides sp. CF8]EON23074.1 cell envelope-related transcriptional [Nocardioides sp. CF8]